MPSTPISAPPPVVKPRLGGTGVSLRVLAQLIQALEAHAIRGISVSPELMIHDLDAVLAALDAGRPDPEVFALTGEAGQAVGSYFASIAASLNSLGSDLESGIAAIAGIAGSLGAPQSQYSSRLSAIQERFQQARGLDDLAQLRDHLQGSIQDLQRDTQQLIAEQDAQRQILQAQLAHMQLLAKRTQEVAESTSGPTAAILRFKRLQVLADRYGPGIGKQIRGYVEEILRTRWPNEPRMLVFPPDCLVVIDEKEEDVCVFKHILRKLAAERMVFNAKVDDREVMVRVGLDWTVVRLRNEAELEELVPAFLKKFSSHEARESA